MKRDAYADEIAVIALGSNLPWRDDKPSAILRSAVNNLGALGRIEARSGWWRTPAWPEPADPEFLNLCVRLRTSLEPVAIMARLLEIEREHGRERSRPNAPRTLDLDLVDAGGKVLSAPAAGGRPALELPHPRVQDRAFVLLPLADVAPDWRHPVSGARVADLIARLAASERTGVRRVAEGDLD